MTKLMIDELTPGMVLEEAVKNTNGAVLIPSEVELSEKHIRALKMWGIVAVTVKATENGDAAGGSAIDPGILDQAKSELRPLFALANVDNPIMGEIFKQAAIRHARSK